MLTIFTITWYDTYMKNIRWNILDVLVLTGIIGVFMFYDPFHLNANVLKFLRLHFFILTKEPRLFYYLAIHIPTIILKTVSIIFLAILVHSRRELFWRSIVFCGKLPNLGDAWMPLYLSFCIVLNMISRTNPLLARIPFDSVFIEAKIIGNIVIIFSTLVVAPFVEEILFRGFLYPALKKSGGMIFSIVITSGLFTLAHYPQIKNDYTFMAGIFFLSVIITYGRAKTGSTMLAVIMHHLYNLIYVGIGFTDYVIAKI